MDRDPIVSVRGGYGAPIEVTIWRGGGTLERVSVSPLRALSLALELLKIAEWELKR